jgi:hypothetical protein
VETFIRYRGVPIALGTGRVEVEVGPTEGVEIASRNGWMNHVPFTPELHASRH